MSSLRGESWKCLSGVPSIERRKNSSNGACRCLRDVIADARRSAPAMPDFEQRRARESRLADVRGIAARQVEAGHARVVVDRAQERRAVLGSCARSRRHVSSPSMPGRTMSTTTRSGSTVAASDRPSSPVDASPTSTKDGIERTTARHAAWKTSLSSMTRTLTGPSVASVLDPSRVMVAQAASPSQLSRVWRADKKREQPDGVTHARHQQ